jgi:hypothetical protein
MELDQEHQVVRNLLEQFGLRTTNSDVVELASEQGVNLTWEQVASIRWELAEMEQSGSKNLFDTVR